MSIICRADAHTLYSPDYVRRCVEVLEETGAENVGGLMRPVGTTTFGPAWRMPYWPKDVMYSATRGV